MADNKKLLLNIFSALQDALLYGDPLKEGRFAAFMQPGEFIPVDIEENDSSKSMWLQSEFSNKVIDTSIVNRYEKVGFSGNKELLGSVNEVYQDVLTQNSLPHINLTPEQQRRKDYLRDRMRAMQKDYDFHESYVEDLIEALSRERNSTNPDTATLNRLRRKLRKARQQWRTFGYEREYKLALAEFMQIMRISPAEYFNNLRDVLDENERTDPDGNSYFQTFLSPSISSWNSTKWNQFERQVSEKDEYHYSKSTSWSGGISGRWGMWSWGGGASGNTQYNHDRTSATTINLKFEYMPVRILRPWMRESVLGARYWTWNKLFGGSLVSDGGALLEAPPIRPKGRMPVLVNKLIVVKNLTISGDFSESEREFYREQITRNASVGWGPFSVSGSYTSTTQKEHIKGSFDGINIRMDHPQIIAKMGIILPECPNPDRSLAFDPDDAWFPEDGLDESSLKLLKKANHLDYLKAMEDNELFDLHKEAYEEYQRKLGEKITKRNTATLEEVLKDEKK